MQTKKIVSLLLALLMVLSAVPMMFMTVAAEEAAATPGELPATLPTFGGDFYVSQLLNKSFTMTETNGWNGAWPGNTISLTDKTSVGNSLGMVFKFDTSNYTGSNALVITFELLFDGSTYVCPNPGMTSQRSGKIPSGAKSTWYVSTDGATWNTINASSGATIAVTTEKTVGYVFIPLDSFWANNIYDDAGYSVNGAVALAKMAEDGTKPNLGNINIRTADALKNENANMVISDFGLVYSAEMPTRLPVSNKEYTTTPLFSATMGGKKTTGWISPGTNSAGFDAFKTGDGIMFKMSNAAVGETKLSFALQANYQLNDATKNTYICSNINMASTYKNTTANGQTSTWYISDNGSEWVSATQTGLAEGHGGATNDMPTVTKVKGEVWVYIPFSSMYVHHGENVLTGKTENTSNTTLTLAEATALVGDWTSFGLMCVWFNNATTTLSDFQVVKADFDAPATLPDLNQEYTGTPLFTSATALGGAKVVGWETAKNFNSAAAEAINVGDGLVFKVKNTALTEAKISFAIHMTSNMGTGMHLCSNIHMANAYKDSALQGDESSTWYISSDGVTWTSTTQLGSTSGSTQDMPTSAVSGFVWVYIPFAEMYSREGKTQLLGGAKNTADPRLTFGEATELVGGWRSVNDISIWFNNETTTLSDFQIVSANEGVFNSASATLTDDLSYNLYSKIPADATNVKLTFQFADKTVEILGVDQPNGTVKYSYTDILPQNIGEEITVIATYLLNGKQVTKIMKDSVLDYALRVLDTETLSDWHQLMQALINYAAAAQAELGEKFTGTSCAEYVKALSNPVTDRTTLEGADTVSVAGDSSKFVAAALRLEGMLEMRITVSSAVESVNYSINGRNGTVTVVTRWVNGETKYYAYIPVCAYELGDTLVVSDAANAEDVLNVSVNYYLAKVDPVTDTMTALIDAVANYGAEAAKLK